MIIRLEVQSGGKKGETKEFQKDTIKIGRELSPGDSTNDIAFDHRLDTIASRDHCEIRMENGRFVLHETSAKNKTYVNGTPVTGRALADGDVIQCGTGGPEIRVTLISNNAEDAVRTQVFDRPTAVPAPSDRPTEPGAPSGEPKQYVGKRTMLNMIGLAITNTEKSTKKKVMKLTVAIASVAAVLAVVSVFGYFKYIELREADKMLADSMSRTEKAVAKKMDELRKKNEANSARMGYYAKLIEDFKSQMPNMKEIVQNYSGAVVRINHTFDIIDKNSGKKVVVADKSGKQKPCRITLQGSGFCIKSDGVIVTNAHVVQPWLFQTDLEQMGLTGKTKSLQVTFHDTSKRYEGTVQKIDQANDLALIKISKSGCNVLSLNDKKPEVGDKVVVLGFPLVAEDKTSDKAVSIPFMGNISKIQGGRLLYDVITQEGNSGGPVITMEGKIIAVHSAGLYMDAANRKFALQGAENMIDLTDEESKTVIADPIGIVVIKDLPPSLKETNFAGKMNALNSGIFIESLRVLISGI